MRTVKTFSGRKPGGLEVSFVMIIQLMTKNRLYIDSECFGMHY